MSRAAAVVQRNPEEWGGAVGQVHVGWEPAVLLALTAVLLAIGVVSVYSASAVMAQSQNLPDYHFVTRQATGAAAGFALLAGMAYLDYRRLRLIAWPVMFVLIVVLLLMVVPGTHSLAPVTNGARRWFYIGPVGVQPSELAKLVLIVWTAALVVKKQDRLSSLSRGLLPFLVVWTVVCGLIFVQPSMSAALLVAVLAALVVFAGGARIGHFLLLGFVGIPLLWTQVDSVGYRMRRIIAFLDPTHDSSGISYQITQSLTAIGSGGIFGRGFGHGAQKFGYLPEPHNDFLFAMIGEEWGFIGAFAVISLFAAFAVVGYRIARCAPDLFGFLLAVGITNLIAVQAMLHIAVNLALVPTTGVTLPFMSYGRSSLLVCLAGVGILINIGRRAAEATA
jgi:cell division protein FtsW